MTAPIGSRRAGRAGRRQSARAGLRFGRWPTHLTIFILMIIWLIPTIGLLINSFRPGGRVDDAGWWTAIFPP